MHIICVGVSIKNPNIGDFDGKLLKPNTYTLTHLCDSKDTLCEQTTSAQLFHKQEVYVISMSNTTSETNIMYGIGNQFPVSLTKYQLVLFVSATYSLARVPRLTAFALQGKWMVGLKKFADDLLARRSRAE